MKTIGLIGGMSWESSAEYYRLINQQVNARLGGQHSAKIVLYSVDFGEIEKFQAEGRWGDSAVVLKTAAKAIEAAGGDLLVLCTNTMHRIYEEIRGAVGIPFLHIAEATGQKIAEKGVSTVGLLGTSYTMEHDFYKGKLIEDFKIDVVVPLQDERRVIHDVIYEELCLGQVRASSRERYRDIIAGLVERGAEGIILGCTEITLLVGQEDSPVPIFDTTSIHAAKAVEYCLQ